MGLFFYKAITMGILVRKYQQGGELYYSKGTNFGNDVYREYMYKTMGAASGYGSRAPSAYKSGSSKSGTGKTPEEKEATALTGALSSDIDFYKEKKSQLSQELEELSKKDAEDTPEYKQKLTEYYELETEYLPKMKAMAKLYSTSKTAFGSKDAGDAPAIANGMAIVYDTSDKEYKVVSADDLIKNAKNYQLQTAGEVLTKRANDRSFSGFTDVGKAAELIINNAYGQKSFDKYVQSKIKGLGYERKNGVYTSPDGDVLSLDGGINGGDKTGKTTKTNAQNVKLLFNDILGNDGSFASSYVTNLALRKLYNRSRISDDYKDIDDTKLNEALAKERYETLKSNLRSAIKVDQKDQTGKGGSGEGSIDPGKPKYSNVMEIGAARLLTNKEHIEVENDDALNLEGYTRLYNVPAANIDLGGKLMELGYEDTNKALKGDYTSNMDDKADDDPYLRRTIDNNTFVKRMAGSNGVITNVEGVPLVDLTDGKSAQKITTPRHTNVHLVLAPVEEKNGRAYVNFNSDYANKAQAAIEKTYKELEDEGITREVIALGRNKEAMKKAEELANKNLKAAGVNNLTIRLAAAFDVLYEAENKGETNYSWKASDEDSEFMNNINDDVWTRDVMKTKAFVPVSDSFFANMFAEDAFPSEFRRHYQGKNWEAILKEKNETDFDPASGAGGISNHMMEEERKQAAKKEQEGGKLASADEVAKLLFE